MEVIKQIGNIVAAITLTIAIAFLSTFVRHWGQMGNYVFSVINQRGPTPYVALFMMMYVVVASISAMMSSGERPNPSAAFALLLLSLGPLCVGYIGYTQAMQTMDLGIARYVKDPRTLEELRNVVGQIAVGRTVAFDPLILGLFASFVALAASLTAWRHRKREGRASVSAAN